MATSLTHASRLLSVWHKALLGAGHRHWSGIALGLAMTVPAPIAEARSPGVQFDVAPIVAARPVESGEDSISVAAASLAGDRVTIDLQLSALVTSPTAPPIDQMLIEVDVLDAGVLVDDFSPRTQLASPLTGDIAVEHTEEANKRLGFNVTGRYSEFLHGDVGGDFGEKQIESRKFQRVAPVEVVAASGTINRGRGVFFKLRATPSQVLEGDKSFSMVLRIPATWRGGTLRVRATAQVVRRGLPGMGAETITVGDDQFLVTTFLAGDMEARRAAMDVAAAERQLRVVARDQDRAIRQRSTPNLIHQVATALDLTPPRIAADWMQRAVFGSLDPHHDAEIRRLPVDVRVAVLDYQEAQRNLRALAASEAELVATRDAPPLAASAE